MPHLYHLIPDDFRGDSLLPLQLLGERHPDLYEQEIAKWVGREAVLDVVVPYLGVPWRNTVNLAALDPARLVEARRRLELPVSRLLGRRVLRIPVERIDASVAVEYDSRSHWLNSRPSQAVPTAPPTSDFTPFDPVAYEELAEVPQQHLDYLVEQRDAGQPALGFVFVKHVLVAAPIDVTGLDAAPLE